METNPIALFQRWFDEHRQATRDTIPEACCLSTLALDGFPNARFVSLKDVSESQFFITGNLTSRKGLEIRESNKVALTFWWPEIERQVRLQGDARSIQSALADRYFAERSRESQIVSIVSRQGKELRDAQELLDKYEAFDRQHEPGMLKRPDDWGGYAITPVRMEFLGFQKNRFHQRELFLWENEQWHHTYLQP